MKTLIIFLTLSTPILSTATETGTLGYWNYEKPTQKKIIKNTPSPLPSEKELMKLPPSEIRKLGKIWLEYAIQTASPSAVKNHLTLVSVANKKAKAFAATNAFIQQRYPNLSLNSTLPTTNAGRAARFSKKKQAVDRYLKKATKNYGLIYFSSATCIYCRVQDKIIKQLLNNFNFKIKVIDFDANPTLAQKFNITQTPAIIVIQKNSPAHFPIANGTTSLPKLTDNLYAAIRYLQSEITPSQFFTNEIDIDTPIDPEHTNINATVGKGF
jgi:conjugal transfer pilus assembly protein TraF